MRVNLIAALSLNRVIGCNNKLPWALPEDLSYFKEKTLHHSILMGRHTYESIGRPLAQRKNLVITSQQDLFNSEILIFQSLQNALRSCIHENEVFIIGGAMLYQEALSKQLVDRLYLTEIKHSYVGDTYFPILKVEDWREIQRNSQVSSKNIAYDFVIYDYIKKEEQKKRRLEAAKRSIQRRQAFEQFMSKQCQFQWE